MNIKESSAKISFGQGTLFANSPLHGTGLKKQPLPAKSLVEAVIRLDRLFFYERALPLKQASLLKRDSTGQNMPRQEKKTEGSQNTNFPLR
jgi:hypothetical protein